MPDPVFTLTHRGQGAERSKDTRSRTLEWDAFDPSFNTPDDVIAHPDFPTAFNQLYPLDETLGLYAERYGVRPVGGKLWKVVAQYSKPPDNGGHEDEEPDNPLAQPPRISWSEVFYNEAVDRTYVASPDTLGHAITNSARVPFSGLSRPYSAMILNYEQNYTSFDIGLSFSYRGGVNSDSFLGAAPTEVRCTSIVPTGWYTPLSNYVAVSAQFEFRPLLLWGKDPHQLRILDKGRMAWATVSINGVNQQRLVEIVTAAGDSLQEDALLDGKGRPIDTTLTYRDSNGIVVASPSWLDKGNPPGVSEVKALADNSGYYLYWKNLPSVPFSGLNISF